MSHPCIEVDLGHKFILLCRIKGANFSVPNLLGITPEAAQPFDGASLAIFRLAPADYHRFHCPIDGVVGDSTHIPGQYYTGQFILPIASQYRDFSVPCSL